MATCLRKVRNSLLVCCWKQRSVTSPVAISSAAKRVVVPLRLSSWVCFSGIPGRSGRIGAVRSRAWIWVFVRHEALHHRMEVKGLHPRPVAAGQGS